MKNIKHKNHDKIVERIKSKKLEQIATKMLKRDDLNVVLRGKGTSDKFFKLFK